MGALLDDLAVFHNKNEIGINNSGEAMSDHEGSATLSEVSKGVLDKLLGAGVDVRGGLVEDNHRRIGN